MREPWLELMRSMADGRLLDTEASLSPGEDEAERLLLSIRTRWLEERKASLTSVVDELERAAEYFRREQERSQELAVAERSLQSSRRLAALGNLAASVAHECNQPLTVIQVLVELLSEGVYADSSQQESIERIRTAAERLREIVAQVRQFGQPDGTPRQAVPVSTLVAGALDLLRETVAEYAAEVEWTGPTADSDPILSIQPGRLQQVLVNLIRNACQAVMANSFGQRRVRVLVEEVSAGVIISVADNGPGVPPEVQAKLFEPFNTTKGPVLGMGLGLSVSRTIVEGHGGTLKYRRLDGWTRFDVWLPGETHA